MKGRDGTDTSYWTSSIPVHVGASYDALIIAPPFQGPGTYDPVVGAYYDTYPLFNRDYHMVGNLDPAGFGGQRTEVRVFASGTLPPQTLPNT
jgi:hypothetical protein